MEAKLDALQTLSETRTTKTKPDALQSLIDACAGVRQLDALETLITMLPDEAPRIRHRHQHDFRFRVVCEDYRETLAELDRLEQMAPRPLARLGQHRVLAATFLDEATLMLASEPAGRDAGSDASLLA